MSSFKNGLIDVIKDTISGLIDIIKFIFDYVPTIFSYLDVLPSEIVGIVSVLFFVSIAVIVYKIVT